MGNGTSSPASSNVPRLLSVGGVDRHEVAGLFEKSADSNSSVILFK
ncbi:MAG: hypothetical protein QM571_00225 [Micrococcaceae bacterium]